MKKTCFLAFILIASLGFAKPLDETYVINITYTFKNIEEGYDHLNKAIIYVDGEEVTQSRPLKQSQKNSVRIEVTKGKHEIKVENWANYNDKWELHDMENGYSFDLINTETINVNKNKSMVIVYDLDEGVEVSVK